MCSQAAILLTLASLVLTVWSAVFGAKSPHYDLKFNGTSGEGGQAKVFITAEELEQMMASEKGVTILDARNKINPLALLLNPGAGWTIPGAYRAHWLDFIAPGTRDTLLPVPELEKMFRDRGVSNDVPVVVYGSWTEAWGEEGRIYWQLDWLGHKQTYILYGGLFAWKTRRQQGRGRSGMGDFVAHPVANRTIDANQIMTKMDSEPSTLLLLDVRTTAEYEGAKLYGAKRGGHVPSAVHYGWKRVFTDDGSGNLKNPSELHEEISKMGRTDGVKIAAYCTGGIRSGFMYAVLKWLGYKDVANYAGSWWDWASREDLPISTAAPAALPATKL